MFALTVGEATAKQTATMVIKLLQKMVNLSISEPKPFLYTLGLSGRLSRVRLNR